MLRQEVLSLDQPCVLRSLPAFPVTFKSVPPWSFPTALTSTRSPNFLLLRRCVGNNSFCRGASPRPHSLSGTSNKALSHESAALACTGPASKSFSYFEPSDLRSWTNLCCLVQKQPETREKHRDCVPIQFYLQIQVATGFGPGPQALALACHLARLSRED